VNSDLPVAQSKSIPRSGRVASIDAARGTAMLFVCLAHFTDSYFFPIGEEKIGSDLVTIGMVASPTFVIVSGLVAGFLFATRRNSFGDLQRKLFDRGLFLLIIGHLLLAMAGFAAGLRFATAFRAEYITDAIAFAIMLGPWLLKVFGAGRRLSLAAAIFAFDWLAVLFWTPSSGFAILVKTYLIGVVSPDGWGSTAGGFAILPWFSVYLTGTVIGQRIGSYYASDARAAAHLFLARIGATCMALSLTTKAALVLLSRFPVIAARVSNLLHVVAPYQKFPPGPIYLCFFGGTGILLLAAVLELGRRDHAQVLLKPLRQIGLASFFVYIVQFYLYSVVLRRLRFPYTPLWPLLFIASLALLASLATLWNSKAGNEYLTVGVAALLKRVARNRRRIVEKPLLVEMGSS